MQGRMRNALNKTVVIVAGLCVTAFFAWLLVSEHPNIRNIASRFDYLIYDLKLKHTLPDIKTQKNLDLINIVDIDEKSLKVIGRWPWSRQTMSRLIKKLKDLGVVVIAYDILYTEPETNISTAIIKGSQHKLSPQALTELKKLVADYNYDQQLAHALQEGSHVLGFVLDSTNRESSGQLPAPLLSVNKKNTSIRHLPAYTAPLPKLLKAAKNAGFVTTVPDSDGTLRRTPIVLRHHDKVFPSLALAAVKEYLLINDVSLIQEKHNGFDVIEGIQLGDQIIPIDEYGQALIPFIGPSKSFPTYSAADILADKIKTSTLEGSIVFIGSSALGLSDLKPTPLQSVYPGVEVHATVAAGILNKTFKQRPFWAKGLDFTVVVSAGILIALILPFLPAIWILITTALGLGAVIYLDLWFWNHLSIDTPISISLSTLLTVGILNLTYGYFSERSLKKQMQSMFSQYVPPAHISALLSGDKSTGFEGESRNMSVLFMDIRNFTHISESMRPSMLKQLLNEFFTDITDIIFKHDGTIDKYVGDMVMAFWGAPLPSHSHARDAIATALGMIEQCKNLEASFKAKGYPDVRIGVGVNTGMMNVGDMGSVYRRNYTVLGDAVNLGSRLEGITKFYKIDVCISEFTYAAQADYIARKLDKIRVKGKDKPVTIFEPLCLKSEVNNDLQQELEEADAAFEAYYNQDWHLAQSRFTQLANRHIDTYVYKLYLERIESYQATPPPDNWDGVTTFTTK